MKELFQHIRLITNSTLFSARTMNLLVVCILSFSVITKIWTIGRKVDNTLAYLQAIPSLQAELSELRHEKNANSDSLLLFRSEVAGSFRQVAGNLEQMDGRITHTNASVKMELKKMNEYFILLSSSNEEIKRMLMIKKENDKLLFEQIFPTGLATK
ncbi:hypothetical protein [Marinilabilia rubra]|uniref:Uncharacterized protein n=1 Tax=Marinilabilia rubra TaxID=2162893 RepID=A0A2U2B6U5_9BACT|nr:hypothetical protein [Marinilabilia rubra]PWD98801.1 hypothetical protein DDZ16_13765 [Marinilabilia rubra]